jgi:hypothetical protein
MIPVSGWHGLRPEQCRRARRQSNGIPDEMCAVHASGSLRAQALPIGTFRDFVALRRRSILASSFLVCREGAESGKLE